MNIFISPGKEATVSFTVVKLDEQGKITQPQTKENRLYREDLGSGISLEMVHIPAGKYWRRSPDTEAQRSDDEGPMQEVSVKEFWMGRYTITQAQWEALAGLPQVSQSLNPEPSYFKGKNLPVEKVSWGDTQEFLERLCRRTGKKYSLPSEAQAGRMDAQLMAIVAEGKGGRVYLSPDEEHEKIAIKAQLLKREDLPPNWQPKKIQKY